MGVKGLAGLNGAKRNWLTIAALATVVVGMLFGLLLPIYTDELAWRFHERAWLDQGFDVWMNDVCTNMVYRAPLFMMPARWFSANMNLLLADPLLVRLTGVALALSLVAGFWRLVGIIEPDAERRGLLRAIVCGLLATGVFPVMLVISRPEQPFFLAAMGMALLTLPVVHKAISARRAWLLCTGLVLLTLLALSYHLKGLLYSVFALACLLVLAKGTQHIVPRMLAAVTIVVLDVFSFRYWLGRFDCPTNTVMQRAMEEQNVVALLQSGNNPVEVLLQQLGRAHIFKYAELAAIHPYPMSAWMPVQIFTTGEGIVSFTMTYLLWGLTALLAAMAVWHFLRRNGPDGLWARLWTPRVVLVGTLFAITFVWGLSQVTKNVYEAMHILPAWIMMLLFAWTLRAEGRADGEADNTFVSLKALRLAATLLLAAGLLSQVIVIGRMSGPLWAAAHNPGRLPLQRYSISLADYPSVRADIGRAMREAGMDPGATQGGTGPDGRLNRLLVDDLTYLALQRSYLPIYALGVMGPWNGPINDPAAFLVSRDSDGIVASCASLWQEAADAAARSGEICAINRQQLQRLAGGRPFVPANYSADIPLANGAYAPPPGRR